MTFFLCLLMPLLITMLEVPAYMLAMLVGFDVDLAVSLAGVVGVIVALCILHGTSLMRVDKKALLADLRVGWWLLAVAAGISVFDLIDSVSVGISLAEGWALRTISLMLLCGCIGFYEEALFRGVVLHGLLALGGKTRRGMYVSITLAALAFGAGHIDWVAIDYGDGVQVLQMLLKIVQAGLFGFFLTVVSLRSKNVMGAALLHGAYDFMLMVNWYIIAGNPLETDYVSSGEEGWETVILYLVVIALYIPLIVKSVRMLRDIEPTRGAFLQET